MLNDGENNKWQQQQTEPTTNQRTTTGRMPMNHTQPFKWFTWATVANEKENY